MELTPYLNFPGTCETAFKFYADVLGGKIVAMMKTGDTPMANQIPPERHNTIMHASLDVRGKLSLMGSDAPPDMYTPAKGMTVTIGLDDSAEAERIFAALSKGGTVRMALQQTFWAIRFGMLTDQFGIPWMINCAEPTT